MDKKEMDGRTFQLIDSTTWKGSISPGNGNSQGNHQVPIFSYFKRWVLIALVSGGRLGTCPHSSKESTVSEQKKKSHNGCLRKESRLTSDMMFCRKVKSFHLQSESQAITSMKKALPRQAIHSTAKGRKVPIISFNHIGCNTFWTACLQMCVASHLRT